MTIVASSQMELIPGYRLLERLGQGGFGEVWKAEAPGGLLKAIKIVYGSLNAPGDGAGARQELKALERVKAVRHPYLLSLDRYDIVNGQLVIVTELADKNLWDRFLECSAQGLPGIPRDELLRYLDEAAEALDLMNIQYQLQHLDIKPQNLFLVHNHIKVADFGLVKDLEGIRTKMTSGITAAYAPPETFEGLVSPYCDQYNLAIVYQEMLTGRMPFAGSNPRQLMMQHVTALPNLETLPPEDRAAIGRALAKKPEERHGSCGDLVRALRQSAGQAVSPPQSSWPVPAATPPPPPPTPYAQNDAFPGAPVSQYAVFMSPIRPASILESPGATSAAPAPVLPSQRPEVNGDGLLFPAVVVGLGGAGRETLRCLRKAIRKRWGADGLPNVRLLLLDTDPGEILKAFQGDADTALCNSETFLARLQRPSQYLKPGRERQALEKWLAPDLLSRLPRDQTTPKGSRALGRLAFASHATAISSRLATELAACMDEDNLAATAQKTGLGLRSNRPRCYIVGTLGGGTGGGMFLDVAYTARHRLQQLGYAHPDIQGVLLLPPVERAGDQARASANTFGALTELAHFSAPGTTFSASYLDQREVIVDPAPPFSRCMLLPMPRGETAAAFRELATLTGEYLVRELATPLGRVADEQRSRRVQRLPAGAPSFGQGLSRAVPPNSPTGLVCQTFGAYWFAVPRRLLLQRVARCLCHRLVQSWQADNAEGREKRIQSWIAQQLAHSHLTPGELAAEVVEETTRIFKRTPDEAIEAVLAAFGPGGASDLGRNLARVAEAREALEQLVGCPTSDVATMPTLLGEILGQTAQALGSRRERCLAEVAFRALAEPHFRLLGLESQVQDSISDALAEQARTHRTEAEQLTRQAAGLYLQMAAELEVLRRGSFWGRGKKNRVAAELITLLRTYGQLRWQAMTRQAVSRLYQELQTNLQKYLRKVECCRTRIVQFLQRLEDPAWGKANVDLGLGQYLLPAGCRTLGEAVEQILSCLAKEELEEINQRVQGLIGRAFEAQVHLCTAPADFFKELEEEVLRDVTNLAESPLGRAHAAEMYLAQRGQEDTAVDELAGAFDQAAPELAGARRAAEDDLNILAVPPGPEGEHFRLLVQQALPDNALIPASSTDDIVFHREVLSLSLTAVPQLGQTAEAVYRQFLTAGPLAPHSRTDIAISREEAVRF